MNSKNVDQVQLRKTAATVLLDRTHEFLYDVRQWRFPPEFRIARPLAAAVPADMLRRTERGDGHEMASSTEQREQVAQLDRSITAVAVCLWDIRRKLQTSTVAQQDRKLRLLNRRAEKAILALEEAGVVIDDPIGCRYAAGSEGAMKPNFQPTPGTTCEKVVETITPMVYREERLIGRGEVFVAVPIPVGQEAESVAPPTVGMQEVNGQDTAASASAPPEEDSADAAIEDAPGQMGDGDSRTKVEAEATASERGGTVDPGIAGAQGSPDTLSDSDSPPKESP